MREAAAYAAEMDLAVIPYELEEGMTPTRHFLERAAELGKKNAEGSHSPEEAPQLGIFIGPEGGFTEEEISNAGENRITPISLGKRILRTETAGMALLAALMLKLEAEAG